MEVSVTEESSVKRSIDIIIPRADFDSKVGAQAKKVAKTAHLKGFRPGKAPVPFIQKNYGGEIRAEVLQEFVRSALEGAIDEHKLNVVGNPEFDFASTEGDEDVKVNAKVEVYPEVKLTKFEGLDYEFEPSEFSEEMLEKELEAAKDSFANVTKIEDRDIAEDGDMLVVSYNGTIDGEAFQGGEAENARVLLGSDAGMYPDGFEKGLVGLKVDQTKTIECTYGKDIVDQAIAGKKATFEVTLNTIYERVVPELTDEFVKEQGLGESLDEWKGKLETRLTKQVEEENSRGEREALMKEIVENNPFEIPQALVDEEIRQVLFEARLLDPRSEESYQVSMERFRENLGEPAEFRAKQNVLFRALIEELKIEIGKDEIDSWLDSEAKIAGVERGVLEGMFGYPADESRIKGHLVQKKLTEEIVSKNKRVKAKKAEEKKEE